MKKYSITFGVDEDKDGKAVSPSTADLVQRKASYTLAKEYGGVTLTWNVGSWVNGKGLLVKERSFTLSVVDLQGKGPTVAERVAKTYIKVVLNQSSVLFVSENVEGVLL